MDKLEGWQFDRTAEGWRWHYSHPVRPDPPRESERAFPTLLECVNDAARNGYILDAQRRP